MSDLERLREQARRCFRLAKQLILPRDIEALEAIGAEFERLAREAALREAAAAPEQPNSGDRTC
jgi:hypothetical protein